MKKVIHIKNLVKNFTVYKRSKGIWGSVKGLFHREKEIVEAVKSISIDINEAEFIGFIGPNGAGKTTTLKMLSGILHPTEGEIEVLGKKPFKREAELQKQFALVMGQKNQLWWDLPAIDSFQLNKAIYEIPNNKFERNLDELTTLLDIKDIMHIQVRKLSLGQRMKCELAAALLHEPKILFLDEPTIGLDVISQKTIRDFLRKYNKSKNATILLTSHYMEDIRKLCKRVVIIDHGKILYDGSYNELIKKYADHKMIDISFQKDIKKSDLEEFGEILKCKETRAKIRIPRSKNAEITSAILKKLPIEDISIHETSIEEVISKIFKEKKII